MSRLPFRKAVPVFWEPGDAEAESRAGGELLPGLDPLLQRSLWFSCGALLAGLPLPWLLGATGPSYIATAFLIFLMAGLIAASESPRQRRVALSLFCLAFIFRFYVHLALFLWGAAGGGPFLGPDSQVYFDRSLMLAQGGFTTDLILHTNFGTYDVGHYYLFGAVVRLFGHNLFVLQSLNCGLLALVAPLTYSVSRRTIPRYATVIGLLIALSPALTVLAAKDLLKDSSVLFALSLAFWGIFKLTRRFAWRSAPLFILAIALGLGYSHISRAYGLFYLEVSMLGALVVHFVRSKRTLDRRSLAALAMAFVLAEGIPGYLGWPSSPVMFVKGVEHVLKTDLMIRYSPGLMERLASKPSSPATSDAFPGPPSVPNSGADVTGAVVAAKATPKEAPPPQRIPGMVLTDSGSYLSSLANVFRKLYGPFVWVMPQKWSAEEILRNEYLLYPGMLIWYSMLPFIAAGFASVPAGLWRWRKQRFGLTFIWLYCAILMSQYLFINLSYRQRDSLLPLLTILASAGFAAVCRSAWFWRAYALYWVGLFLLASVHLVIRA